MNHLLLAELSGGGFGVIAVSVVGIVIAVLLFLIIWASRYTKVGPNEVLIVSGKQHRSVGPDGRAIVRGFRVVKGGGTFIMPVVEKADVLSLELLTIDVQTPEVYTSKGVPVKVDGVAQIKVKGDDISIATAAEQFLSKSTDEIKGIAMQTLEGHLRAILGTMTVEEIYQNRDAFASKVQEVAAGDMANMGLNIVSFTIRDIRDTQGYLDALGKPRIAQVKRDAVIAQAEADRDSVIRSAQAGQAGQEAKFAAAQRDYQMSLAEYTASVNQKKAESELAYDLQKFKTSQLVKAEEVQVTIIEKQKQIELQQQEIQRKQRELEATVQRPADAERYRVETLATARKFQLETEAAGTASATKATGFAQADVVKATGSAEADANKARGLAEAAVIEAQGLATAEAMRKKAESFKEYNQAAIIQLIVEALPQIAGQISAPLAKTEKMVIINGGGPGGGASKLTGDVTTILSQLPPVLESLTGVKLEKLLEQVPAPPEPRPSAGLFLYSFLEYTVAHPPPVRPRPLSGGPARFPASVTLSVPKTHLPDSPPFRIFRSLLVDEQNASACRCVSVALIHFHGQQLPSPSMPFRVRPWRATSAALPFAKLRPLCVFALSAFPARPRPAPVPPRGLALRAPPV